MACLASVLLPCFMRESFPFLIYVYKYIYIYHHTVEKEEHVSVLSLVVLSYHGLMVECKHNMNLIGYSWPIIFSMYIIRVLVSVSLEHFDSVFNRYCVKYPDHKTHTLSVYVSRNVFSLDEKICSIDAINFHESDPDSLFESTKLSGQPREQRRNTESEQNTQTTFFREGQVGSLHFLLCICLHIFRRQKGTKSRRAIHSSWS